MLPGNMSRLLIPSDILSPGHFQLNSFQCFDRRSFQMYFSQLLPISHRNNSPLMSEGITLKKNIEKRTGNTYGGVLFW